MGQDSKIEWTHHTFNAWRGCTKVSDGCKNCYADALSKRNPTSLGIWGPRGTRVVASDPGWKEPVKWDKAAAIAGERHRVFCASLADVFEGPDTMPADAWPVVEEARKRLFDLICHTPNLDWLLLTKRPENALETMVRAGLYAVANPNLPRPQPNIWIGASVENQAAAEERIPHLMRCPAAIRFLSCEPLLGEVDLTEHLPHFKCTRCGWVNATDPGRAGRCPNRCGFIHKAPGVNLVIVGGESGHGARRFDVLWANLIVEQCKDAGVPAFVKQLGGRPELGDVGDPHGWPTSDGPVNWETGNIRLRDKKGGDPSEWPEALRVREMPSLVEAV
jgi:protein gp37